MDNGYTEWVPAWAVAAWQDKVAKANRKAARNGLGEPFAVAVVDKRERVETIYGAKVKVAESLVRITGETVSLDGWRFAATVDWSLDAPVLNVSPFYEGATLPRPESKVCEHCGTIRSRTETFLVVNGDGDVKQVGRQCLTAFTGIPLGWVSLSRDIAENDGDDWYFGGSGEPSYAVPSVLALGIQIVDALGYVSRGKAEDMGGFSTRDRFEVAHDGARANDRDQEIKRTNDAAMAKRNRPDAEVEAEVAAIIAWGATIKDDSSDYLLNLRAILGETGWIGRRHLGYCLSAITTYRREAGRIAERAAKRAERKPVTTGRVTVAGTIMTLRVQDSQYGSTVKIRVAVDGGGEVWGTLPRALDEAVVGDRVEFVATVQASDADPTFGFYSRPSKARMLAVA